MPGWEGEERALAAPQRVRVAIAPVGAAHPPLQVKVGSTVARGERLTDAGPGACYAPAGGEVVWIGQAHAPAGAAVAALEIAVAAEETTAKPVATEDWATADQETLQAGLTELGWHLEAWPGEPEAELPPVRAIVVFGTDEEPEIAVQRRVVATEGERLGQGLTLLQKLFPNVRLYLVLAPGAAVPAVAGVERIVAGERYLEHDRRLLLARVAHVDNVTPRAAREAGFLGLTAETVAALAASVESGLPRSEKLVTVAGPSLAAPVTVRARLGTPVAEICTQLELDPSDGDRLLLGGRWRGFAQFDLQAPITAETDGLTLVPAAELVPYLERPCINCGRCVRICPVRIPVNLAGRYAEFALIDAAEQHGALACIECGLCAYVCPAQRPLLQYMRYVRREQELARARALAETAAQAGAGETDPQDPAPESAAQAEAETQTQ